MDFEQKRYDMAFFQLKEILTRSLIELYIKLSKNNNLDKYHFLQENKGVIQEYVNMLLSTQIQLFNRNSELITRECIQATKNPIIPPILNVARETKNTKELSAEITQLMLDFATGKLDEAQKILAMETFAKYAENMSFSERQGLISLVIYGKKLNAELEGEITKIKSDNRLNNIMINLLIGDLADCDCCQLRGHCKHEDCVTELREYYIQETLKESKGRGE